MKQTVAHILRKTKTIIKHSNLFNDFISSRRNSLEAKEKVKVKGICPPKQFGESTNNKVIIKSMSVDSIHLPHISDTIYIQPKEVMRQIQQQREMVVPKALKKANASKSRFNNDIFSKTGYSHLIYDESLIFNRKAHYQQLIKDQIAYYQSNKNSNPTEVLTQTITNKDNSQLELSLTSLKVKFVNEKEHLSLEIILPLAFLPVYYSMPLKKFILLLAGFVQFAEKEESLTVNEEFIYLFIKNEFSKRKQKANMPLLSEVNLIDNPKRFSIAKFKEKSHMHLFNWITPIRTYRVHIIEPLVQLIVLKQHIRFNKYIDFDLLFFLYEKKFMSWDFYVVNYLFSYKRVRTVFDKLVSKSHVDPIENMIINLSKEYFDDYSAYDLDNDYLYTDENKETVLFRIKSGHMLFTHNWLSHEGMVMRTTYQIQFSIGEMKLLLKMSAKLNNFNAIMKRFATIKPLIDKADVMFDYEALDSFRINSFKEDESSVDNEAQHTPNVQVVCGIVETFSKMKTGLWALNKSFELTKENGTAFYQEKKWNQGRAILSIKEPQTKSFKKKETIKQSYSIPGQCITPHSKTKKLMSDLMLNKYK